MPTLDWIGKKAVENHDKEIPYRLIKCEETFGDPNSGNLIVQGDNLEALKALLPYYSGQVKCIYIDPPYNTGNEGWAYNDNVNSPEIREWLKSVVGKEGEDLSRHDKWLCMIYPRLKLLREFLNDDGFIFISIDDNEFSNLVLVMNEIFGQGNMVANIIWQHSIQPKGYLGKFSIHHNYILVYSKNKNYELGSLDRTDEHNIAYSNPDNDPKGLWRSGDVRNALYRPNLIYDILTPSGKTIKPPANGWRWSKETLKEKISTGEIYFNKTETKIIRKIYLSNVEGRAPESIWFGQDVGTTRDANKTLKNIFENDLPFDTPKPVELIERILQIATDKNSIILDSFAGSGTTAHATLGINTKDKGDRKFILIEMDENICNNVTTKRIKKVIDGYSIRKTNGDKEIISSIASGFCFCKLGDKLFDENGTIKNNVNFLELAHHIYFSETGNPLKKKPKNAMIGFFNDTAYYLLFNGILGDKSIKGGNILTSNVFEELPKFKGRKIIFGEGCRMSPQRLRKENIIFKQLPYEIKIS